MKYIQTLFLILLTSISFSIFGQGFDGTVNGILIVKNSQKKKLLFDFQAGPANLKIETEDELDGPNNLDEWYTGKTTSGKTNIRYHIYNAASSIGIELNGEWFEITNIDGAADAPLAGLEHSFQYEKNRKYLILRFTHALELRTHYKNKVRKMVKLLPNSTLIFAIDLSK